MHKDFVWSYKKLNQEEIYKIVHFPKKRNRNIYQLNENGHYVKYWTSFDSLVSEIPSINKCNLQKAMSARKTVKRENIIFSYESSI